MRKKEMVMEKFVWENESLVMWADSDGMFRLVRDRGEELGAKTEGMGEIVGVGGVMEWDDKGGDRVIEWDENGIGGFGWSERKLRELRIARDGIEVEEKWAKWKAERGE